MLSLFCLLLFFLFLPLLLLLLLFLFLCLLVLLLFFLYLLLFSGSALLPHVPALMEKLFLVLSEQYVSRCVLDDVMMTHSLLLN